MILPAYMRKSPKVTEVLPVLYLRGLSSGDFAPALDEFFGTEAGLSASSIDRLTVSCRQSTPSGPAGICRERATSTGWADGTHFNVRLEDDRDPVAVFLSRSANIRR